MKKLYKMLCCKQFLHHAIYMREINYTKKLKIKYLYELFKVIGLISFLVTSLNEKRK